MQYLQMQPKILHFEVKRSISKGRITSPKILGSIRDVPIFEELHPFIEDQPSKSESLYLFDRDKKFLSDASFFKKRWHKLILTCNIEYRKLYDTRHTFITTMLHNGNRCNSRSLITANDNDKLCRIFER